MNLNALRVLILTIGFLFTGPSMASSSNPTGEKLKSEAFEIMLSMREALPWIREYSPYALATADDPPIYLYNPMRSVEPEPGEQGHPTHSLVFGIKLKERLNELGVESYVCDKGHPSEKYPSLNAFLVEKLQSNHEEHMKIGTNFWDVGWGGERNDPFINGHKNVSGENPWKPDFLEEIKIYAVFRFMDWGKVNNAIQAHDGRTQWEDRVKKTDRLQKPMAYEWMIDLCNRTQRDMWVCVPHFADEHYMYQLACLIRDNLDSELKCYVEWSNETWNGMFKQAHYCNEQAKKLKLPPGTKWENNLWYRGQMYHAHRTFETFYQFEQALKDQRHRLVTVIGGTIAHAFARTHIWAIDSDVLNPHKMKPQAYALAPYFGNGLDGSAPDIVQKIRKAINERMEKVSRVEQVVKEAGLNFITYEGGQHVKQHSDVFCANPAVYDVYIEYLNELEKHFSLFMHYTHNETHSSRNSWGAKRYIGEAVDVAHKYRALRDYAIPISRDDLWSDQVFSQSSKIVTLK